MNLKNLNTGITLKTVSSANNAEIVVLRGIPYEWFVVSKATGTATTASSASWKFYNEGPGVVNYAPFPADAINPSRGSQI